VEDDRVENENQDDGARTLNCGGGGSKDIELCDGHGDSGGERGGDGDDDSMQDDHDEDEGLEDNGCGQEEEGRRRRRSNILFRRTMLMSLIGWISSTGASHPPSPVNPIDSLFG